VSTTLDTQKANAANAETQRDPQPVDLRFSSKTTGGRGSPPPRYRIRMRSPRPDRPPGSIAAYAAYYGWQVTTKLVLGCIYVACLAEGLKFLVPPLGQKLHKIPGLSFLETYDATYRLDLAIPFSLFMLIAVFFLWSRIIRLWLEIDDEMEDVRGNRDHQTQLIVALGFVILGADLFIFYVAVTQVTWGGSAFSFTALLATGAYVAVLIFVTYVGVVLRQRLEDSRTPN
jgi:hypothetical protein